MFERVRGISDESKVFRDVRKAQEHVAGWVRFGELPPQTQCTLLLSFILETNCLVK
jgi:hypothetical protein